MFNAGREIEITKKSHIKKFDLDEKNHGLTILNTLIEGWISSEGPKVALDKLQKIHDKTDLVEAYIDDEATVLEVKLMLAQEGTELAALSEISGKVGRHLKEALTTIGNHLFVNEAKEISISTIKSLFKDLAPVILNILDNTSCMKKNGDNYFFTSSLCKDYFVAKALSELRPASPSKQ